MPLPDPTRAFMPRSSGLSHSFFIYRRPLILQSGPKLILLLMGFPLHLVLPALPFPLSPTPDPTPTRLKQVEWSLQRSTTPLAIPLITLILDILWALRIGLSLPTTCQFSCLLTVKSHSSSISSFDSLRSNNGIPYNFGGHAPSPQMLHYPSNSRPNSYQQDQRSIQLFDPENHQRPHPGLMTHFIQVFFERFGPDFPFLQYQDILADFWDQRLSLIVANCVAAMAVKCAVPHPYYLDILTFP